MTPDDMKEESVTLPTRTPIPGGLLAALRSDWLSRGWDLDQLDRFRMGPDDPDDDDPPEEFDGLSDEELEEIRGLSADDVKALKGLTDDQRAELAKSRPDPRLVQARQESVKRRRELKPWKDLGREFGMTPDEMRDALEKANKKPKGKGKADDVADADPPDPDAVKRQADREAAAKANARIVKAEVKVLAADLFADPADAHLYLDISEYDVDDDGELVDPDQVVADLREVLQKKPHLAKKPRKPRPDDRQRRSGEAKNTGLGDAGRAEAARRFGKQKAEAQ